MTNERFFIEINDDNSVYDGETLKVTLPKEKQSCEGVDFYFSKEYAESHDLVVESASVYPAPLECYWNWLMKRQGEPEYETRPDSGTVDIGKYTRSGVPGAFGFSGHTNGDEDIVITFKLKNNNLK